MKIIICMSDELTTRTAIEIQWHTLNTSPEVRKLAFNPLSYAKCRVSTKQISCIGIGTENINMCIFSVGWWHKWGAGWGGGGGPEFGIQ